MLVFHHFPYFPNGFSPSFSKVLLPMSKLSSLFIDSLLVRIIVAMAIVDSQ